MEEVKLTGDLKEKIVLLIEDVLVSEFGSGPKSKVRIKNDRINFSCPYCGDSKNPYKKRGNLYFDTLMYHCFNGGCSKVHTNLISFLKDFGILDGLINDLDSIKRIIDSSERRLLRFRESYTGEVFESLNKYALTRDELKAKLGLREIHESEKHLDYIQKRFGRLALKLSHFFLVDSESIYILNLISDNRIIGFVKRFLDGGGVRYKTYNLEGIYSGYFNKDLKQVIDAGLLARVNKFSVIFNSTNVDFSDFVYVCEGPFDFFSLLFFKRNSICLNGVNNFIMFNDLDNLKFILDNDEAGKKVMIKLLKEKKYVFLWDKFLKEEGIKEKVKDLNDLFLYCLSFNDFKCFKNIDKYITNDKLNLYFL